MLASWFVLFVFHLSKKKKEQMTNEIHTNIDKNNHNREIRKGRRGFIDEVEHDDTSAPL
jgi:hypothetical protein